jgi:hypothetical protein
LLRAYRKRPRRSRTAEKRDELAPFHVEHGAKARMGQSAHLLAEQPRSRMRFAANRTR